MKKALLFFACAALCAPVFGKGKLKSDQKVPIIQFETMKVDFGQVIQGELPKAVFKFKNVGTGPLVVTYVEKVCGCAHLDWTKDAVAPGGNGEITLDYNSAERPGIFRRSVVVKTNMGKDKDIFLMIKGDVIPPVDKKALTSEKSSRTKADGNKAESSSKAKAKTTSSVGPKIDFNDEKHDFGKINSGDKADYEFTFTNNGNQPLVISDAQLSENIDGVKIEFPKEAIKPGATGKIHVSLETSKLNGRFNNSIVVKTNDFAAETKELVIKGKVQK
jgi:hypothetical protein